MAWKQAARIVLHRMGGLPALRYLRRGRFRVLMFHEFRDLDKLKLEAICEHITRQFEPVPLTALIAAMRGEIRPPPNAVAVTVDDGYRNFLLHGHPIFRKYRIPTTVYAVAGFSDGQLWLWTDKIVFALEHAQQRSLSTVIEGAGTLQLDLSSPAAKQQAVAQLCEALKLCPNEQRVQFLNGLGAWCGVEIPAVPPADRKALSWEELRALSAEDVEIGCHSYTHPILARIHDPEELDREIRGAKELMERRLKSAVSHFCYPNGRDIDIDEATVACTRAAGFVSSATCTYGLNTLQADPLRILRVPCDSGMQPDYAAELLAGLHM
jgi:peptidoglycan/xylan/chitin deacetylase (PgdA/CDA1 family)